VIVKPETVIAWHRKGFRLFWAWKVRRGQPGRPSVPKDVRELISKMIRENPFWGAPGIHGETLTPGLEIGETSVTTRFVRRQPAGSQNTGRHGPAPTATCFFSGSQFLVSTRSRTRHTVRDEPTLGPQSG
jgi:hypothetical protein